MKEIWIRATQRENFFPNKYSAMCSRHFEPDCFLGLKNRRRLFASAVPTLCLPLVSSDQLYVQDPLSVDDSPLDLTESETFPEPKPLPEDSGQHKEELTAREQQMKRHIEQLKQLLAQKKKEVKQGHDRIRRLKKKVANLEAALELACKPE